ncbi:MAG: 50S ribosomal protein L9 [Clostridia bacterium]|nr:50S ribosomal protein L9 [Clostridia bacterium]
MKVLLLQDVRSQGKAGQIIDVSDGYARNFLFPKGLASPADAQTINAVRIKNEAEAHKKKVQRQRALELVSEMSNLTVKVYAKAGDNGRLFGSVTSKEIASALKEQFDIVVDRKKIYLEEPIRALGIVTVTAHMFESTNAKFKVEVLPIE